MADLDDTMREVSAAQHEVDAARSGYDKALGRRDRAIRAATAAGATYVALQKLTGMSPTTISKALRRD